MMLSRTCYGARCSGCLGNCKCATSGCYIGLQTKWESAAAGSCVRHCLEDVWLQALICSIGLAKAGGFWEAG